MIKQLQEVSLKSLDLINKNAEGLEKLAGFLHNTQLQLNDLATKVLKLEAERDILFELVKGQEKRLEDYERPKN